MDYVEIRCPVCRELVSADWDSDIFSGTDVYLECSHSIGLTEYMSRVRDKLGVEH